MFFRGLSRACPVCSRRRLTRRWVSLPERCPRCGFTFERDSGHFVGAVGMSTIFTFGVILIVMLVLIAVMWPDIEPLPILGILLPIAVILPLVVHANARLVWAAIDLAMRPLEEGEAPGGPEEGAPQEGRAGAA
mgnify:CR=1 FL=1